MHGLHIRAKIGGMLRQWVQVFIYESTPDGKFYVPKPLEWIEVKDLLYEPDPTIKVSTGIISTIGAPTNDTMQELMDSLWECGFRPTQGQGSAGQLAATQEHLKDMKQIAFHLLDGEKRYG